MVASVSPRSRAASLDLEVSPVPLNPEDPGQESVGSLRFRGGLWLRSPDLRFGGLSDLVVSGDGSRLVAVSDCGRGFVAHLEYDGGGNLVGLGQGRLVDLAGPGGRALHDSEIDAEALASDGPGPGLLVGFEGRPRVWRYPSMTFAGSPEVVPQPRLEGCSDNRGLESLVRLDDGRLVLLCEGSGVHPSSSPGWVGAGDSWTRRSYPLDGGAVKLGDVYRPTSAALLPGGDLLVLERRYPPLGARIRRLSRTDIDGTGTLEQHEVAVLEPPLTLDNLEGIETRRGARGETLVYLLSDDNGCTKGRAVVVRLQRTLLLMFELDSGPAVARPPSSLPASGSGGGFARRGTGRDPA